MTSQATGGEAQPSGQATVHQVPAPAQSPSRRLRRCCCGKCTGRAVARRLPPDVIGYSYRVVRGVVLYSGLLDTYEEAVRQLARIRTQVTHRERSGVEVERVWLYKSGGLNYELIRGGRWVESWQANYGDHQYEDRAKVRR